MSQPLNAKNVEVLKVWYAAFTTVMDAPLTDDSRLAKLRALRDRLKAEAPGLERN